MAQRRRGFLSAWGCCARCGKVVSCRARTADEAEGSKPYVHKWAKGADGGWCDGHGHPALHYTESDEFDRVKEIELVKRQMAVMRSRRGSG